MFRQYLQQSLYHLRENSLLGTALSICMIMVVVITLRARIVDCAPEVNRSRTLYVPNMTARPKTATDGGMNSRMSVQTGRECFKALTMPEAVTLYTDVDKVRASLPAGDKLTADMRQVDSDFWHIFHFRFLDGKPFSEADFQSALPRTVISATVARRLFGRTEGVAGQHLQLNHVDYQVVGVVADVSMLAADSYAQVWIPYTTGTAEANTLFWPRVPPTSPPSARSANASANAITTPSPNTESTTGVSRTRSSPTFTALGPRRPTCRRW